MYHKVYLEQSLFVSSNPPLSVMFSLVFRYFHRETGLFSANPEHKWKEKAAQERWDWQRFPSFAAETDPGLEQ